ncbi:hypothetical protein D3C81_1577450 [compost metagenome]
MVCPIPEKFGYFPRDLQILVTKRSGRQGYGTGQERIIGVAANHASTGDSGRRFIFPRFIRSDPRSRAFCTVILCDWWNIGLFYPVRVVGNDSGESGGRLFSDVYRAGFWQRCWLHGGLGILDRPSSRDVQRSYGSVHSAAGLVPRAAASCARIRDHCGRDPAEPAWCREAGQAGKRPCRV